MTKPLDPFIAEIVETLPPDLQEDFQERAGIMEYDGELPRANSECRALLSILRRYPELLSGVTVLRFQLDGKPRWLVATDLELAGRHLAHINAEEVTVTPLVDVVTNHCGGLASLVRAA